MYLHNSFNKLTSAYQISYYEIRVCSTLIDTEIVVILAAHTGYEFVEIKRFVIIVKSNNQLDRSSIDGESLNMVATCITIVEYWNFISERISQEKIRLSLRA